MRTFRIARLVLVLLLMSTLTGCSPGNTELVVGLLDEWAREKGLNPKNEKGEMDPWNTAVAAYNVGRRVVTGSTGDADADAALGVLEVVYPIRQLDQQTDEGIDKGDASKVEGAIKGRPDDYHYRNALGVVQLAKGDASGAKAAFLQSEGAWQRANPKQSIDKGDEALARDALSLLDRAIKGEANNGTTDEGKLLLRKRYCQEARFLKVATGSGLYLDRAKNVLKFDCSKE